MPLKLLAPGTRKGNRFYIAKGRIAGVQYEVVCLDEEGSKTADARAARRFCKRFTARAYAKTKAERRQSRGGTPETFGDAIESYMIARGPANSDRRYLGALKEEIGHLILIDVVQADILTAGRTLYPDHRNETINRQAVAPGAAVLHFAAENDWAPYRVIKRLPERQPEMRRPKTGTLDLLLDHTEGKEHLLLLFLARQGTRITETLGLRGRHTFLEQGDFELYVSKSRCWQKLALHDELIEAMEGMDPEPGDYWFPWRSRGYVYKWLRPLCEKLGVTFTPHMARHEFGGSLRQHGATARDLVDVGSWTSVKSTARYQDAPADHAREILHRPQKARGITRGKA